MVNFAAAMHLIKGSDEGAGWTINEINKGLQVRQVCPGCVRLTNAMYVNSTMYRTT